MPIIVNNKAIREEFKDSLPPNPPKSEIKTSNITIPDDIYTGFLISRYFIARSESNPIPANILVPKIT